MTVGDMRKFALESSITHAFDRPSLLGLGFFVIYVGGRRYGVKDSEATMLANSFDAVSLRLDQRGTHFLPFPVDAGAVGIASAAARVLYDDGDTMRKFFGVSSEELNDALHAAHIIWAPDGDQAFDDGSHVLQFDVQHRTRLIAFTRVSGARGPEHVREEWLPSDYFYGVLQSWKSKFYAEWASLPKAGGL